MASRGTHDGTPILMTGEIVDQAKVFPHAEEPVQRRRTQIGIHEQDPLAKLCESNGQVGGDGGLALSGLRAGDQQRTGRMIGGGKQDGCAKTAKRFCQRRVLFRFLINAMPCQSRLVAVAIFFVAENLGVFQQPGHAEVVAVELGYCGN